MKSFRVVVVLLLAFLLAPTTAEAGVFRAVGRTVGKARHVVKVWRVVKVPGKIIKRHKSRRACNRACR